MKHIALLVVLTSLAGCVSTGRFKEQESSAATQKKRAEGLDQQVAALKSANTAAIEAGQKIQFNLSAQLKANTDQLTSVQTSNKDLQQTLDAKKGELTQKVSALIKERDTLTQRVAAVTKEHEMLAQKSSEQAVLIAGLQKKTADAEAARTAAEAAKAAEAAEVEKVKKSYEDLTAGLKSEIAAGEIKITQLKGKLTVNLVDRILFDSGKAEVKDAGHKVLDKVGSILNTVSDKNIRIEGHTDNKPITGELLAKYPSNWELSTARATAVARYLQDKAKVDSARLVAAGYGEFHPVASNDTPESRALNRRIEIVLVTRD